VRCYSSVFMGNIAFKTTECFQVIVNRLASGSHRVVLYLTYMLPGEDNISFMRLKSEGIPCYSNRLCVQLAQYNKAQELLAAALKMVEFQCLRINSLLGAYGTALLLSLSGPVAGECVDRGGPAFHSAEIEL
jgi:hypothetical protein